MTAKRYRVDVLNQVMDTNYDWYGNAPPFDQYIIDEDDYLVIGTVKTNKDGEAICDLLNELHDEKQSVIKWIDNKIEEIKPYNSELCRATLLELKELLE